VCSLGLLGREERERKGTSCADHGKQDVVVDEVEYLFNGR
jgi:hypothetical protein